MAIMDLNQWKDNVKRTIHGTWKEMIETDAKLAVVLESVLDDLHAKHKPSLTNWSAAPNWLNMFKWTNCPANKIRAMFLLMEPLEPKKFNTICEYWLCS